MRPKRFLAQVWYYDQRGQNRMDHYEADDIRQAHLWLATQCNVLRKYLFDAHSNTPGEDLWDILRCAADGEQAAWLLAGYRQDPHSLAALLETLPTAPTLHSIWQDPATNPATLISRGEVL